MSAALAMPRTGFKFMLIVDAGPDKGASFQLLPPRVTIGRGADCDVALRDPRMSRLAAVIELSMEEILISDMSQRQTLYVNDHLVPSASLKSGDRIAMGETEIIFNVEALTMQPPSQLRSVPPQALPGQQGHPPPAGDAFGHVPYGSPSSSSGGFTGRTRLYTILGVVVLGLCLLMMMGDPKKKDSHIKTVEEIEEEIKSSQALQTEIKQRIFKSEEEKTRFNEANRHFAEGFRDFERDQWVRAMRSFETARTIDPQHQLAERYYKLAEKKRDEMIANLTLEGRRYREKNMFARCSAQFAKVLELIPNRDDAKYKAADTFKRECGLRTDDRFKY